MSFTAISAKIMSTLQGASAITTLVSTNWAGKTLNVKVGFKTRQEINVSDLPIVLIVRPERKLTLVNAKQYDHDFILFVGIHCENRASAPGLLDSLENAIEDAMTANYNLNGTAVDLQFLGSSNDMGMYHPIYFTSMQFNIMARK